MYAAFLLWLSGVKPFWLDEILQLIGTRDLSGQALLGYAGSFPGAAPLGYFAQHWAIVLFGFSAYSARFSSLLCSVLGCWVLLALAGKLQLRNRWFPVVIWMMLPLQLRYSVEARPYSQALLFSALGLLCLVFLGEKPNPARAALFAGSVLLGLYTAPYTVLLQAGFALAFLPSRNFRALGYSVAALAVAALGFLPWYLWSSRHWTTYLNKTKDIGFTISPKFFLLPIQEISGGGYVCSLALISLAAAGVALKHRIQKPLKLTLVAGILSSFFGALLMDAVFGYFFAIRQIMFLLVPLTLLAADGFSALLENRRRATAAIVLMAALVVGSLVKNTRFFLDRRENWAQAAALLRPYLLAGACPVFPDRDDFRVYQFYEPLANSRDCPAKSPVILAISRYNSIADVNRVQDRLVRGGYVSRPSLREVGVELKLYVPRAHSD